MNLKTLLPLVLAIVLGLIAAKFTRDAIVSSREKNTGSTATSPVLVDKHGLWPGQSLTAEDLVIGQVGKSNVPDASFTRNDDVIGRVVQIPMGKGQPIVESLLAPKGAGAGLQALVPKGMRAITIEINEFSSVGGMILPGSHVDVLATLQGKNGVQSKTIVQNVKVTAIGQRVVPTDGKEGAEPFKSVTLLTTPEQTEAIELAATLGRPRLCLRGGRDGDLTKTKGVDVAAILGESRGAPQSTATVSDPFATPGAEIKPVHFVSPTTSPSTQPAAPPQVVDTRAISIIRAGQESFVTITVPVNPTGMVGTDGAPVSGEH